MNLISRNISISVKQVVRFIWLSMLCCFGLLFLSRCETKNPVEQEATINCENYCAFYSNACLIEYENVMDCQTQCAVFPQSDDSEATEGDSLQCRYNHARIAYKILQGEAMGNSNTSCRAAQFNGGSICGPHMGVVDRAANPAVIFLFETDEDRTRFNLTDPFSTVFPSGGIQERLETLDGLDGVMENITMEIQRKPMGEIFARDAISIDISNGDCTAGIFGLETGSPPEERYCGGRPLDEDAYDKLLQTYLIGPSATDGIEENDMPFTAEFPYLSHD